MSLNKLCRLWSMRNFYDHSSLDHSGLKVLEIPAGPYSGLREAAHSLRPEPSACQVAPAQARLFGWLPPGLLVWPPRLQLAPPFPFTGETNTFRVRGIKPLYKTLVCRRKASHCFRERANHRAWLLKCFSKWNMQEAMKPRGKHIGRALIVKAGACIPSSNHFLETVLFPCSAGLFTLVYLPPGWFTSTWPTQRLHVTCDSDHLPDTQAAKWILSWPGQLCGSGASMRPKWAWQ